MTEFGKTLAGVATAIPGLLIFDLPVHGDARGWFKENWQRDKMTAAGLPDFGPVQNNVSFNDAVGTTRGIHAEPWDKWVSVATGRIFGAWVDLREGPSFGSVVTAELDPSVAVYVPRGVGNSYQTLEPDTAYTYLVNDHWSPNASYTFLNLADETADIPWPIALSEAAISDKDRTHPRLADVVPVAPKRTIVLGADGQVGRALRDVLDDQRTDYATRADLDLTAPGLESARSWGDYDVIVNAAAFTAVDAAETADGRRSAWSVNVAGVGRLARIAAAHRITLVHISSDYVFDGEKTEPYMEDDSVCPLGVYGQTKAAGDEIARTVPTHYVIRTSWVIGDGPNFVRTMARLADSGVDPSVVRDQRGRLTFASTIAEAIRHLLATRPVAGVYNVTNTGPEMSWFDVAREVFRLAGHDPDRVKPVAAVDYFADAQGPIAPRPANSMLDVSRIEATGFRAEPAFSALARYLRG